MDAQSDEINMMSSQASILLEAWGRKGKESNLYANNLK